MNKMIATKLILETGESFSGYSPCWIDDQTVGEVVFNTGMVGYTETMTDPSYQGQMICFTYPLIGNYGVEDESFWESGHVHTKAIIVSELASHHSRSQNKKSLYQWCMENNTTIITGIDTRALTKVLRSKGSVVAGIVKDNGTIDFSDIVKNDDIVSFVSVKNIENHGDINGKKIIFVDCGTKRNILRELKKYTEFNIKVVPYNYDYSNENYDAVFLSNGPGNPENCKDTIDVLRKVIDKNLNKPIFGICLGSQLMGLAIGCKTYKMKFGHRAQNHPCIDTVSKKSYLTSQNHGYAIEENSLPEDWFVSFKNLNDNTVQGISHQKLPYFSVQFHPEACPGPTDTAFLFDEFISRI